MRTPERELQARMWQVLLMFGILYTIDSVATAIVSVMIGSDWKQLSGTEQFLRVCMVFKAWASTMLALVTMVVKRVQNQESPFPENVDKPPVRPTG